MTPAELKSLSLADLRALKLSLEGFIATTATAFNDLSTTCQLHRRRGTPDHPDCKRLEEIRTRLGRQKGDLEAVENEIKRRQASAGRAPSKNTPGSPDTEAPEPPQEPSQDDSGVPWMVGGAVLGGLILALTRWG